MSSANRWRGSMVLLACLVIIITAVHVGCHRVEDDEDYPGEDVLLWSHEVTAEDVYVYFDEEAGELVLVTSSGIWSVDLTREEEIQLEQLAEITDPESRFTGLPYVTRCDAGERQINWVLKRGADYIVSELTGDGVDVYMQQEAGERYSEEVPHAHFFVPVMALKILTRQSSLAAQGVVIQGCDNGSVWKKDGSCWLHTDYSP